MKLDHETVMLIVLAALFHDIGKVSVPEDILNKPGALSGSEMEIVKKHVVDGYHMLQSLKMQLKWYCTIMKMWMVPDTWGLRAAEFRWAPELSGYATSMMLLFLSVRIRLPGAEKRRSHICAQMQESFLMKHASIHFVMYWKEYPEFCIWSEFVLDNMFMKNNIGMKNL